MNDLSDKLFVLADEIAEQGSILDSTHVTVSGKSGKWLVKLEGLRGIIGLVRCASEVEAQGMAKVFATLAQKACNRPISVEQR